MLPNEKLAAILKAIQSDPGGRGLARDPVENLFTACSDDFVAACYSLAADVGVGVALFTGFYIPTGEPPAAETDGPLGAVFLATALHVLGYRPQIWIDTWGRAAIEAGLRAHGVATGPAEVPVLTVPNSAHSWVDFQAIDWHRAVSKYQIRHGIAIERAGPSRFDGRPYSMRARDLSEEMAPMHHLIEECHRMKPAIRTIGIGDGGNEIGMGKISWSTIQRNIPVGERIACRVPTDHLVVAGISNWGAYALAAGLFLIRGENPPPTLFNPELERERLEIMSREGPLVDGVTGRQTCTVDGLTWDEYMQPFIRIREILEM